MAFFGVTVETIERVWDHPNADRLSLAKCKNMEFQFVIGKNQFSQGERVLYFPIDALLNEDTLSKLNLVGKLAGSNKNRIKSLKLRNEISQGIVSKLTLFGFDPSNMTSEEITKKLGVEKYEPPVNVVSNGILKPLPDGISVYDIEGADRNGFVIDLLLEQEVVIHEKMEGTNFSITKKNENGITALYINQRNNTIEELPNVENSFWKTARDSGLVDFVLSLNESNITIYAELCGPKIQGNMYNLKKHTLFVFDIKKDVNFVDYEEYEKFCSQFPKNEQLKLAPLLFKGKLKNFLVANSVQKASNGNSMVLSSVLREGIVIKNCKENYITGYGRSIIKQRSPEYLSKTDN